MEKRDILTELLLDASFQAWVMSAGKDDKEHWQKWIKDHPDQLDMLDEAKMTLLRLSEEHYHLPENRKNALRQKLISMTKAEHVQQEGENRQEKKWRKSWYNLAAAVLFLLTLSGLLYLFLGDEKQEIRYQTAYGEIKTIVLPDSTKVTLNGNSSMKFHYQNAEKKLREVWLEGEGFFNVSHLDYQLESADSKPVKFIVHTDNLSIKVLGTRFNVKARHERTQVVLEKGSIQLEIDDHKDSLLMQPDELVEVKRGEKLFSQKTVETINYTGWKEGVISFEGADYEEISSLLKDNYGLELHFPEDEVAQQINLRGTFPSDNIDILLEAIANVTHTTMKKKGNTIMYL